MSEKIFFLTTPIYYINSTPHIGHFYTTLAADARARFERLRGRRVYFLTGTDEHGLKIVQAARARGLTPQQHADEISGAFREAWDTLGISYDDFIRTTEARHEQVAQRVISKLWSSGHLRLDTYSAWYSVPDETFFRPEDTIERDGKRYIANPTGDQSQGPLEWVDETSHFFRLAQFQDELLHYYEEHPETLRPESRRNEVLSFIKQGLQDNAISRELEWGIPIPADVPEHEKHSVYVWFEALMNYFSGPGYLSDDPERQQFFEQAWPPDLQLMSKDIFVRFHSVLWPSLLKALDLPLPTELFAHGFWTVNGRKMSKRDPETIVEPIVFSRQIADLAGCEFETAVDALKYYCLREVTFGSDGDFSRNGCLARYNSDLANNFGNLVNRAVSMLAQFCDSTVPLGATKFGLRDTAIEALPGIEAAYARLDFSNALNSIWEIISLGNRVIEEQKPWVKDKAGEHEAVASLLCELLAVCQWCAVVLSPVMPHVSQRLLSQLAIESKLTWALATDFTELLTPGHRCAAPQPLFPRIKDVNVNFAMEQTTTETTETIGPADNATVDMAQEIQSSTPAQSTPVPETAPEPDATIEYADFAKVQLRAARILEAERVPKADKLLRLQVDLGTEKRQILAGIAQQFEPDTLIGKTIVVVANLAPRKMRGLESQGMLLAASADVDGPPSGLVTIDADVPPGSIIR